MVNSFPLSLTIILGLPRVATNRSSSVATSTCGPTPRASRSTSHDRASRRTTPSPCVGAIDPLDRWLIPPHLQQPHPGRVHERALVPDPCRRPRKVGGLAQRLQRRPSARGDRQQDAEFTAKSRWRIPPATVTEGRKLYLPVLQGRGADRCHNFLRSEADASQRRWHILLPHREMSLLVHILLAKRPLGD